MVIVYNQIVKVISVSIYNICDHMDETWGHYAKGEK